MVEPYYSEKNITIYNAGANEVLADLRGVDLAITSPRYNCDMDYDVCNDSTTVEEYLVECEIWFHLLSASLNRGAFAAINIPNYIGSRDERVYAPEEFRPLFARHLRFVDEIIWVKGPPNGAAWGDYPDSPRLRANHEYVLIYRDWLARVGHNDISWADWSRLTVSVWPIQATLPMSKLHPATFPIELPRRLIRLYAPANGLVCDPFMGTGTTLLAAKQLGRRAVGIEMSRNYCDLAIERLRQEVFDFAEPLPDLDIAATLFD